MFLKQKNFFVVLEFLRKKKKDYKKVIQRPIPFDSHQTGLTLFLVDLWWPLVILLFLKWWQHKQVFAAQMFDSNFVYFEVGGLIQNICNIDTKSDWC